MAFDGTMIAAMAKELNQTITQGRIAKISQPETDEILFTIKTRRDTFRLCLSASPSLPLVYFSQDNKPSPMNAPNFCMVLRKHLGNGKIIHVFQPDLERILVLEIEHRNELGDLCKKYFIAELMGKHSNLILCDASYQIIDSIKHISLQTSSIREVLPGRSYFIPNTLEKASPFSLSLETFPSLIQKKNQPMEKLFSNCFCGISPILSLELLHRMGIEPDYRVEDLSESLLVHCYQQFRLFMDSIEKGEFSPRIYYKDGVPKDVSSISLSCYQNLNVRTFPSVFDAVLAYYDEKNSLLRRKQKSLDLRQLVQTSLERNRKKLHLQYIQLEDTKDREKWKSYGELLHTYGYSGQLGDDHLTAYDFETGMPVLVPLNPLLTPFENATVYFEKYNKKKRTFEHLSLLIQETEEEVQYLESVANALNLVTTDAEILQIQEELIESGYIKKKIQKRKRQTSPSKPLHYLTPDGYHLYVGKNNLQNEMVSFEIGKNEDWWFHAKGIPGSHVILKSEDVLPKDSAFEDAGRLAAYYSSAKGGEKVEIDYLKRKNLKKPKGGKPGFVIYHTNYSLFTDSSIEHLRLLEDSPSP